MDAKFKFEPNQVVISRQGFQAPIQVCGLTSQENRYLLANQYREEWIAEGDLEAVVEVPQAPAAKEKKK